MTERQKRFADYYLETGNARKAAVMAGYSVNYAEHVRRQPGMKEYLAARLGQHIVFVVVLLGELGDCGAQSSLLFRFDKAHAGSPSSSESTTASTAPTSTCWPPDWPCTAESVAMCRRFSSLFQDLFGEDAPFLSLSLSRV